MLFNGGSLASIKSMPQPTKEAIDNSNRLIVEELRYDRNEEQQKHDQWINMLTLKQKGIYDEIMNAVLNKKGGVLFLYMDLEVQGKHLCGRLYLQQLGQEE